MISWPRNSDIIVPEGILFKCPTRLTWSVSTRRSRSSTLSPGDPAEKTNLALLYPRSFSWWPVTIGEGGNADRWWTESFAISSFLFWCTLRDWRRVQITTNGPPFRLSISHSILPFTREQDPKILALLHSEQDLIRGLGAFSESIEQSRLGESLGCFA